jgi:hypothetical protein
MRMNAIVIVDVHRTFIEYVYNAIQGSGQLASSGKLSHKMTEKPIPRSGPSSPGNMISLMRNKVHYIKQE